MIAVPGLAEYFVGVGQLLAVLVLILPALKLAAQPVCVSAC